MTLEPELTTVSVVSMITLPWKETRNLTSEEPEHTFALSTQMVYVPFGTVALARYLTRSDGKNLIQPLAPASPPSLPPVADTGLALLISTRLGSVSLILKLFWVSQSSSISSWGKPVRKPTQAFAPRGLTLLLSLPLRLRRSYWRMGILTQRLSRTSDWFPTVGRLTIESRPVTARWAKVKKLGWNLGVASRKSEIGTNGRPDPAGETRASPPTTFRSSRIRPDRRISQGKGPVGIPAGRKRKLGFSLSMKTLFPRRKQNLNRQKLGHGWAIAELNSSRRHSLANKLEKLPFRAMLKEQHEELL